MKKPMQSTSLRWLLFCSSFILFFMEASSQTWTGVVSTDWETAANWSTSTVPTTASLITIPTAPSGGRFPVISNGIQGCNTLTIQSGATVSMTGGTLQLAKDWNNSGTFNATGGTVEFTGSATASNYATGTNNLYNVIINSGVSPQFDAIAGSTIRVAGNFTNNNAALAAQTTNSTFIFNGSSDQTINNLSANNQFGHLVINKAGGTVSLNSILKTAGNLTITAGTFSSSAGNYALTIGGSANLNGGSFLLNESVVSITGNWTNSGCSVTGFGNNMSVNGDYTRNSGSFSSPNCVLTVGGNWVNNNNGVYTGGSVTMSGAAKTIGGTTTTAFPALLISGTVTMSVACSATSFTVPAQATAATLSLANGVSFAVSGNVNIQQPTAAVTSALNVNAGNVTITGNLTLGGSNTSAGRVSRVLLTTGTMSVAGNIVFNAALSTPQNAVIDQSGGINTVSAGGNLLLTNGGGTITPGSSIFIYNGTADQQLQDAASINYNNLFVNKPSGTLTLLSDFSSTGSLTLQSGTISTSASNYALQTGNLVLTAGTLSLNNSVVTVNGNYTNNGGSVTGNTCNISVSGDFTRNSGSESLTTGTVTVNGNWVNNNAAAFIAATVVFTGSVKTISGTVAATFPSVIITTGSITASINLSCTALTLADNNVANSFTLATGTVMTINGNLTVQQAAGVAVVHSFNVNAGTVSVTGNVTIGVTNNLAGNLARIVISTGELNIDGNLAMNNTTLAANGLIDMSGGAGNLNLSGAFTVNSLGTLTPGTTSTFTYSGAVNQTLRQTSAISYNIVRVNKTGGQLSIAAALTISGSLQVDQGTFATAGFSFGAKNYTLNGGTFAAGNSTITVNGNWTSNGGTYTSSGTTALRTTGSIGGGTSTSFGRLMIGLGSTRTISSNHSCNSLVWESGAGTASLTHAGTASLTINGAVTLQQPTGNNVNTWNLNGGTATASGLVTMAGTDTRATRVFRLVITTGTLNAFGGITMVAASNAGKTIDMSGGAGTINLKGALTAPANSGTLTAGTAGSTFNYADDANSQTVSFFAAGAYHNLHINNTTASGATLSIAITATNVTGNLRVLSGKLSNNSLAITLSASKTFEVANTATFVLGGITSMVTGTSLTKIFGATSTVNYAGTTQTVTGENYGNLTISGSGTKTISGSTTVNGTLSLAAGTFALASSGFTLTLNGAVGNDGGTMTGSCSANITIGGSGATTTLPGLSVSNFTLNRAAGISISGNLSVCTALFLTSGIIKTNTFSVLMATGSTVTRTAGHVNGNLRKNVATGSNISRTFEVGGNINYSPVAITFASVTTTGELTASAVAGDHPNINTSTVSSGKSAARYWTLTNSAIVFTSYSAVFNFVTADVDPVANTANFIAGRYSGAAWTYPTVGTRMSTSTQVTGVTGFGSFQVGEFGTNSIKTWTGGAGTQNWGDAANWNPSGVPTTLDIVDLGGANTININVNAVSNDLRIYNSSLILNINSGFSYAVNGDLNISSGTLNTAQAFPTVSGNIFITGGTVGYTAASGTQTVSSIDYNNLTISGGGTKTLAANTVPSGDLLISGGTFDLGSFTCDRDVEGGTMTISAGATLKIGGTNSLPMNYTTHSIAGSSSIEYAGAGQSIGALRNSQNYGNLIVSGTGVKTLSANIGAGNITISSSSLALGAFTLNVSGTWTNNGSFDGGTGVVTFTGTSSIGGSAVTTFKNIVISGTLTAPSGTMIMAGSFTNNGSFVPNNGTVNFNGTSVIAGTATTTFHHIVSSGTLTGPAGTMNVAGNWTNTGVFNHNAGTVNFNGTISQTIPAVDFNNLTSSSTGSRVLSPSGIITIYGAFTPGTNSYTVTGSTVEFLKDGAQVIPAFAFFNLNVSGYGASGTLTTKTATGAIMVNSLLNIDDSVTLNMGTFALGGTMTAANGIGFLQTQNTTASPLPAGVNWAIDVLYNSNSAQTIVTGNYTKLVASGGNRTLAAGTVAIEDVFTTGVGTYTTTGNTVVFNGVINQTIPVIPYTNLILSGAGTTKTAAGNLVVNGVLTTNAGVITELLTFTLSGTLTGVSGTGTIRTANVSATPLPAGKTWTGDIEYYSTSGQTIVAGNYGNLTASGGNRTLASAGVIAIANVFTTGSGTYSATGSTVTFNGTINQAIPAFSFQNLTISKTAGTATLAGDVTVNGTLAFTTGKIVTGTFKVIIGSAGSVSGAAQGTGWVEGNLQRHFATGTNVSRLFDIGGTVYYAPVTVSIASVSTAGSLVARTVSTDHPNIGTSGISSIRSVNRYWTLTSSGIVFTTAAVTFNWTSPVVDAAANTAYFRVAQYASSAWTQPSFASPSATSIDATGLTGFGDFQVGELLNINRWTGTVSTDWNTTGNWSLNTLPVATNNITIPGTATIFPVISSGTVAITDLVIEGLASLTVSSATLQISGSIDNEGTLTATNGAIEFNGTIPQNIPSGAFANNTIKDLVINNSMNVTLQDSLKLTNLLSVKNGSLLTNGFLTLRSTATSTARVDAITSAAPTPVSGNVTVERYIQGRRRYRLITSPVTSTASAALATGQEALSIWAAWQNSGNNLAANSGTFITGGTAADGFDTQVTNASLYTYDAINRRWVGFTSALGKRPKYTPVKAGVAYYMFVYGDRKNSLSSSTPNATVLSATGTIVTGTQTYTTASSQPLNNTIGGFTLLGNPFASPINWATVARTNLENTYWGWDPNLSGTGGYVTVSTAGGTTLIAPFSGTVGLNQYIQSGQGFFVRTSAASPQLQIRETDKAGTINNNAFRGAGNQKATDAPNNIPLMAINLFYDNNGSKVLADGALAAFNNSFTKGVTGEDAVKMFPSTESISIMNGTNFTSIDARPFPLLADTLPLATYRLTKPQYSMEIFARELAGLSAQAFLEDRYLNTRQALVFTDTNRISFNVNTSIPASADVSRFRIIFEPLLALPLKFETITAVKKEKQVEVSWATSEEAGVQTYTVERSADAVQFAATAVLPAKGANGITMYTWTDDVPVKGINYYRIKAMLKDGKTWLSKTVAVQMGDDNTGITVLSNPVKNGRVNLQLKGVAAGSYTMTLYNNGGQAVSKKEIKHDGRVASYDWAPGVLLTAGIYYLSISNDRAVYRQELIFE